MTRSCSALFIVLLAMGAFVLPRRAAADAPQRHKFDARDIALIPGPDRERFERGEALLDAGDFAGALALLQPITTEAPESAIVFRRVCEALAGLGRREDAIAACLGAMTRRGSAMDFRAYVGALTLGDKPLTPEEMSQALVFARRGRELMPSEPWGYAAQCDIARRLGDTEMMNECIKQLERVAPEHRETLRARAMASKAPVYRALAAWTALALACFGTLLHALFRSRRRSLSSGGAVVVGCWLACGLAILPATANADGTTPAAKAANSAEVPPDLGKVPVPGAFSDWTIDDNDPLKSIPQAEKLHKDPLQFGYFVMDLTDRADKAAQRGDHQAAIKFWQALAKVTPDRSYAFAKMCVSYEALGSLDKAIYSCSAAIERIGTTLKDYMRLVGLMLSKRGDLSSQEIATLDGVLEHLKKDDAGKGIVDELACRIGVKTWSVQRLEPCTAALIAHAPKHPDTAYFQWALAAARGNAGEARAMIERAREAGVKAEDIRQMEKETEKVSVRWRNQLGVALGLLLAVGSGLGLFLSRRRSSRIEKDAAPSSAAA